jgi:hypothetical protein
VQLSSLVHSIFGTVFTKDSASASGSLLTSRSKVNISVHFYRDSPCGLVVSVADYTHRGPGFDSRALLRIFLRSWVWNGVHSAS